MNIFEFVNSTDISAYMQEIGYKLSTMEAAWLVYQNTNKTIFAKKVAWEWIVKNMPDEEVTERINCNYRESLHQVIQEYMQLIDKYNSIFESSENNAVYRLVFHYSGMDNTIKYNSLFTEFNQCVDMAKGELMHYKEEKPKCIEIIKQYLGASEESVVEYFDSEMNMIYINSTELNEFVWNFYEGMWFKFPTPFKKGDILRMVDRGPFKNFNGCGGPMVLEGGMFMDDMKVKLPPNGDTTDMTAWGYFIDEYGCVYNDTIWNYMNLEYDHEELKGSQRMLLAVSNFMKEEISIGLLLDVHRVLMADLLSMKDL